MNGNEESAGQRVVGVLGFDLLRLNEKIIPLGFCVNGAQLGQLRGVMVETVAVYGFHALGFLILPDAVHSESPSSLPSESVVKRLPSSRYARIRDINSSCVKSSFSYHGWTALFVTAMSTLVWSARP